MSDYFGHLVSRVLFPSAGVQPRLPSVFEPNAPSDVDDATRGLTETRPRSSQRRAAMHEDRDDGRLVRPERIPAPIGDARPAKHVDRTDADGDTDSALAPKSYPAAVVSPFGELSPVARLRELTPAEAPEDLAVLHTTALVAGPTMRASIADSAVAPDAHADQVAPRPHAPATEPSTFARLEARGPELEAPATRPRVTTAQFATTPTRRAQARVDSGQNAAEVERTVHVSIGRVEIRAAAASPTVRTPAPASSSMTLSEYLRQRRTSGER